MEQFEKKHLFLKKKNLLRTRTTTRQLSALPQRFFGSVFKTVFYVSTEKLLGQKFFPVMFCFLIVFCPWAKNFRHFVKKTRATLSKMFSTCPKEIFDRKCFFSAKNQSYRFRIIIEIFSALGQNVFDIVTTTTLYESKRQGWGKTIKLWNFSIFSKKLQHWPKGIKAFVEKF